ARAGELDRGHHEEQEQPQSTRDEQQVGRPAPALLAGDRFDDRLDVGRGAGCRSARGRADQCGHGATPSGSAAYWVASSPWPAGRSSTNECGGYQCATTSVPGDMGSPADWLAENTDISWPHGVFSRYSVDTPA